MTQPLLPPAPLHAGAVLNGRYRIVGPSETLGAGSIWEAQDLQLGSRPVAAVVLPGWTRQQALEQWEVATHATLAPLVEVLPLPQAAVGIFALPPTALPLQALAGVSREQRAWLLVELCAALEALHGQGILLTHPAQLHVDGSPQSPRLIAIPVPHNPTLSNPAACDTSNHHGFAALLARQLFGVTPPPYPAPPDKDAIASLPDRVQSFLEPLHSPTAGVAPPLAKALQHALGIDNDARFVPVPRVPDPLLRELSRLDAQEARLARRTRRELWLTGLVVLLLGILGFFLFQQYLPLREQTQGSAGKGLFGRQDPEPILIGAWGTAPLSIESGSADPILAHADYQQSALYLGIIPTLTGTPLVSAGASRWPTRVEATYDAYSQLQSLSFQGPQEPSPRTEFFEHDDMGRVSAIDTRNPVGNLVRRRSIDWDGHSYQDLLPGVPQACYRFQFTLDAAGFLKNRSCVNAAGVQIPFPEGHYVEVQTVNISPTGIARSLLTITQALEPFVQAGGYSKFMEFFSLAGRLEERKFFDGDSNPVLVEPLGAHAVEWTWSASGSLQKTCLYDKAQQRVDSPVLGGAACIRYEVNASGQVEQVGLFGANERPVVHRELGIHGIRFQRDAEHRVTQETFIDTRGNRIAGNMGYGLMERRLDDAGRERGRCFGTATGESQAVAIGRLQGPLCYLITRDDKQRLQRVAGMNTDGSPLPLGLERFPQATKLDFQYLPDGSLAYQQLYDGADQLVETLDCSSGENCLSAVAGIRDFSCLGPQGCGFLLHPLLQLHSPIGNSAL